MASMAREGLWRGHRIEVVPNGLPLDIWRPGDRRAARAELGVSDGDILIAASAGEWSARYKGGPVLIEALRRVTTPKLTLVILGDSSALPDIAGLRVVRPGFVKDPLRCASLLSAADLLVHPALIDNFPNSVLEAIACGVPVVSFGVGGLLDMVRPGISGWLAARPDAASLADCLANAIASVRDGLSLRESCRELAEREYSVEAFARSYEAVLASLAPPRSGNGGTSP
jgi:glycosyltransferase involved in cell wall biosynthesis